jgi:hypothetical protein
MKRVATVVTVFPPDRSMPKVYPRGMVELSKKLRGDTLHWVKDLERA